jgi:hypothetical protein
MLLVTTVLLTIWLLSCLAAKASEREQQHSLPSGGELRSQLQVSRWLETRHDFSPGAQILTHSRSPPLCAQVTGATDQSEANLEQTLPRAAAYTKISELLLENELPSSLRLRGESRRAGGGGGGGRQHNIPLHKLSHLQERFCEECLPRELSYLRLGDKLGLNGPTRGENGVVNETPWFVDLMNITTPALQRIQNAVRNNDSMWSSEVQVRVIKSLRCVDAEGGPRGDFGRRACANRPAPMCF